MAKRSAEAMYAASGMTEAQRDTVIYDLWRKRVPYTKIAKRVGISVGAVRASLTRTGERMTGVRTDERAVYHRPPTTSEDW
jgi:DNA-directed RNA polymerase specialized sigma24 family protein